MNTPRTPTENKPDRARIIDKIKKCLSLAKSANEHEASAALRQAQKLMKAYSIDEAEVEGEIIVSEYVDTTEKFSALKPHSLQHIAHLIGTAFGVMIMWGKSPSGRHRITYWGNRASVVTAIYAHKMVYRNVNQSWDDYKLTFYTSLERSAPREAKSSFVAGWCHSVKTKVENLAPNKEKMDRMKRAAEAKMGMKPGELGSVEEREQKFVTHAVHHGIRDGEKFNLHIPLNGSAE